MTEMRAVLDTGAHKIEIPASAGFNIPQPAKLTKLELIRLLKSAGGATNSDVVRAKKDADLEYFWLVFDAAGEFLKTDQELIEGLAAIDALGYIPNGAQAVLDAWPEE